MFLSLYLSNKVYVLSYRGKHYNSLACLQHVYNYIKTWFRSLISLSFLSYTNTSTHLQVFLGEFRHLDSEEKKVNHKKKTISYQERERERESITKCF